MRLALGASRGLLISAASREDAEAILALQKLAYQSEARRYNDWSIPPLTQTLESLREEFATTLVLKATIDGQIVGSVRARVTAGTCAVGRLVVHPDFQGQGIGSRLLLAAEGGFPEVRKFELFTGSRSEANLRLYQRHGYKITHSERQSAAVSITYLAKSVPATSGQDGPNTFSGNAITLRPARETDRRAVYEWLAASDVTPSMIGPPLFPEALPPTWEEFCADYGPDFFDGSSPEKEASYIIEIDGEPVGHVNYEVSERSRELAELDIWMRSEADCGQGCGPDALIALTRHLHETIGVTEFILRPSQRNPRAIRAYEKAGFVLVPLTLDRQTELYGPGDYTDTVVMLKRMMD